MKILSIGNSFSADTSEHLASVALHAGYPSVKVANLFVGGCSIRKHYANALGDLPVYTYSTNEGAGWTEVPDVRISQAIASDDWEYLSIQHGTADGSRYSSWESYADLPALIAYVKQRAPKAKIAFNMTWVGEPNFPHHEIKSYGGDTEQMYQAILDLTRTHLRGMAGLDCISPTGMAVQIARGRYDGLLTRDGYHLSWGLGRFLASLTFLQALTGKEISSLDWAPEGVSEEEKQMALQASRDAIARFA